MLLDLQLASNNNQFNDIILQNIYLQEKRVDFFLEFFYYFQGRNQLTVGTLPSVCGPIDGHRLLSAFLLWPKIRPPSCVICTP